MAERKILSAEPREGFGKGPNRRLRQQQIVPAVFYTATGENIPLQIPASALTKTYAAVGRTTVFDLEVPGKGTFPTLMWAIQRDPCKGVFTHVDLYGVDLEKEIKITVPLEFTGVARGTKVGGKLETYREKVALVSKPLDMPSKIVIDISDMDIGKTIQVADLDLPQGVAASYDVNYAIISVIAPGGAASSEEEATA